MIKNLSNIHFLNLLKYPIITDKATKSIEDNVYYFAFDKKANKIEIKQTIEHVFKVKIQKINTLKKPLKVQRIGKFKGYKTQYKTAIIKLYKEYKIDLFQND
uniref:Large ribosomal subunit protein uL23c n=1 Tax=Taenioma perpusillum TaxID=210852 RepID=A0A1Z1MR18_9FLOR|nr:ribosomal protein L23 [Taenioma perpusillum]ARW68543.1 ribosomal protein L23 [Taenioma perpusillum]